MGKKLASAVLVLSAMASPALGQVAATTSTGSSTDIFQGASIFFSSTLYPGSSANDLFGATDSTVEPGNTIFADGTFNGGGLFVIDLGSSGRQLSSIVAILADDSNNRSPNRGISRFRVAGFNNVSEGLPTISTIDIEPFYALSYGSSQIAATITFASPVSYRYYGFDFTNAITGSGGRVIEIDGIAAAVPEPATWAMMLMGFGLIGLGLRSRRQRKIATRFTFA